MSTEESPGFVNGVLGQVMLVTPQIRAAAQAVQGAVPERSPATMRAVKRPEEEPGQSECSPATMRAVKRPEEEPGQSEYRAGS